MYEQLCQAKQGKNKNFLSKIVFLPPASEGCGKVLFSVCLSVHTSTRGGGVPWSGPDGGGYPSQVWMVGGGVNSARS